MNEQRFENTRTQNLRGIPVDMDSVFLAQGGIRMDQAPPDESMGRKVYQGTAAARITLLEPCVTGIFKSSIRDDSKFTGKKSPFIAFDKQWSMRYNMRNVQDLFEVMYGYTVYTDSGNYKSYMVATLSEAYLHCQYAKPLKDIPRHIKYAWPRFKVYS